MTDETMRMSVRAALGSEAPRPLRSGSPTFHQMLSGSYPDRVANPRTISLQLKTVVGEVVPGWRVDAQVADVTVERAPIPAFACSRQTIWASA
jgi:hypothetical protein